MIINNYVQTVAGSYAMNQPSSMKRTEAQSAVYPRDSFVPSSEGQSFKGMLQELKGMDEVRMDKVESLQQAIANGSYNVSSSDIADAMLMSRF